MIDLRRRVTDYVEGFQEETLTVMCPFASYTRLYKKCEHGFQLALNP